MALIESRAPADPLILFRRWFREAQRKGSLQPDAIALATADARGAPSARMVLFKGIEKERVLFYSNYGSRKGRDLASNRRAALAFYWPATTHQVSASGRGSHPPRAASAAYFHSR